ncbi:carbohydrate ABC transporter permease [Paenibacillus agaridevorans]|nr:carbohydrate ABC transporter permease [Paenibacillus agaridevorans]
MNYSKRYKVFELANVVLLFLIGFASLYPFYYIIIYSISDPMQASSGIGLWPKGFTSQNYQTVLKIDNLAHATFISIARTVIGTLLTVVCTAMFAYGLTKPILPMRKFMYRTVVISMYISAGLIPAYLLITELQLKNTFLVYIIPMIIVPFYLILIKTYMEDLPAEMEESAFVEGAGYFTVFRKIAFPLSMPILATVAIFQGVNQWNSWVDNLYYATDSNLMTLQLMLLNLIQTQSVSASVIDSNLVNTIKVTPLSLQMTITVVVVLPILLVYPYFQRFFIKGIMLGAVKG